MELYAHNKEFLNKIIGAFDKGNNKVAFITATGTGKSYVTTAYIQQERQRSNRCVLIVSPRLSLLDEWKKLLKDINIVEYKTYHKFYRLTDDELDFMVDNYSLIVFDEIHHLGAKEWSKTAKRLFDKAERSSMNRVKFIGLSADPNRYDLDIDIAEELFDDKVVGYSLGEAIEKGVLPKFSYRIVTYRLQENIVKLKKELKGRKRLRAEDPTHLLIDKLDKLAAKYDIEKILKDSLPKVKNNKIIVFVDSINNIAEEMHNFERMFADSAMYQVHSRQSISLNQTQIAEFDDSKHELSFMFSVGMLNEGIHLDNITGIIMLRRTESPTLYMQQLGRILSSNKKINPVVIDFVSNYSLIGRFKFPVPINSEELSKRDNYYKSNLTVLQSIMDSDTLSIVELCIKLEDLRSHKWSKEDEEFLIENYSKLGCKKCAEILQIGKTTCTNKAAKLGLVSTKSEPWSEEEVNIFKNNYYKLGPKGIQNLLPNRSIKAIHKEAIKLKIKSKRFWTDEELDILKKHYPTLGPKGVAELLPFKSIESVKNKAGAMCIKMNKESKWTKNEINILIENYSKLGPEKIQNLLPDKDKNNIISKAACLKISCRPKWNAVETKILIENYPKMGDNVSELLPRRTKEQCHTKAKA